MSHPLRTVRAMSRSRSTFRCIECDTPHPKWAGQCSVCEAWNCLVDDPNPTASKVVGRPAAVARPITEVAGVDGASRSTGLDELDRVLGGGLVAGSVTLVGGEPGIGKSTLLLQLLRARGGTSLYISAEENEQQIHRRGDRLGALHPDLWVLVETSLPRIIAAIERLRPSIVVVDSIQTIADPDLDSAPGSVTQVRDCAHQLVAVAKALDIPVVLVGHVTKEGGLAGPRLLEHIVDTVLTFDGDRHHALRLLRAVKHRFGATDEVGVFEMRHDGLVAVPDASGLFLADRRSGLPGSAVTPVLEGSRPLLVEVQALTIPVTHGLPPRRHAQGIDTSRLALLLAVLERRTSLPLGAHEVFASVVGGVRISEPGCDLGVCLAVASALVGLAVPADLVAFGEVGLAGEVRQAAHTPRRLSEAARMGFRRALVPVHGASVGGSFEGLSVEPVATVAEALAVMGHDPVPATLPAGVFALPCRSPG